LASSHGWQFPPQSMVSILPEATNRLQDQKKSANTVSTFAFLPFRLNGRFLIFWLFSSDFQSFAFPDFLFTFIFQSPLRPKKNGGL
jgi:hypothetical protein